MPVFIVVTSHHQLMACIELKLEQTHVALIGPTRQQVLQLIKSDYHLMATTFLKSFYVLIYMSLCTAVILRFPWLNYFINQGAEAKTTVGKNNKNNYRIFVNSRTAATTNDKISNKIREAK